MSRIAGNGYLEQKAYKQIKKMIIGGDLKPGEVIVQDSIAQKLGVSRTPLRRALAELERDYLVETTGKGIVVRKFSNEFLKSVWEVRAVLEGLACRLATSKIDDAMLIYLRVLFEKAFSKWEETGDLDAYKKADVIFHTKLMEISGNPVLNRNFESTQVLSIAFDLGLLRTPTETYPEHLIILEVMELRDEVRAEQLMIDHIRASTSKINIENFAFVINE